MQLTIRAGTLLAIILVAQVVWDIVAVLTVGEEATISRFVFKSAQQHPIIAFAVGLIMGHLFWPN